MPDTATMPLAMTAPHPRAVGSYGPQAIAWVRDELGITLRWWQQLAMARQLEHDAEGRLLWTYVVESTPRRVGKSVRLRCISLWRIAHADMLGEPQTVLFTGKDLPICKEIHASAWSWAASRGWQVRRGMGNEAIELPDGSRWLVRSQNGVYGYPAGLAACDESWAVPDAVIREGLQPALMERMSPQLLLTSTAHTRATALMRRRIADGLGSLDGSGKTLLLLWAAAPGADPADPVSWRAASPHWDAAREELVADAWAHVVQGQVVPDPLEPDPVAGFRAQYLNQWPQVDESSQLGWGARLLRELPPGVPVPAWVGPLVGGVESERDGSAWGVAVSDGRHVECATVARVGQALDWLRARGPVEVLCHEAVRAQLGEVDGLRVRRVSVSEAAAATAVLRDAVPHLSWSGVLADELRRAQVSESGGVQRIDAALSGGGVSALKAASWVLWAAVTRPAVAPAVW